MDIGFDLKLNFDDVLIRPKRSTLSSRSEVNLEREFKFTHSPHKWSGIPIIASNMDTIGTFDMYKSLSKFKILTCSSFIVEKKQKLEEDREQMID